MLRPISLLLFIVLSFAPATAQLVTDFEDPPYSGSSDGVILSGQEDWYLPAIGGIDFKVWEYTDNALGVPAHPTGGGEQFIGIAWGDNNVGRAQHRVDFDAADIWEIEYDTCLFSSSDGMPSQNLGSFAMQDSNATRSYIQLSSWQDDLNANDYRAGYLIFAADGSQPTPNNPPTVFPDTSEPSLSKWNHLVAGHWYRHRTVVDFTQNRITEVAITDLNTGDTTTVIDPIDWTNSNYYYLRGGSDNTGQRATDIRCFCGGSVAGNVAAYDNVSVAPPKPPCGGSCADSNCDGAVDFRDIDCFVAALISMDNWLTCGTACDSGSFVCTNDVNGSGTVDFEDIDGFVAALINGACQ